MVACWLLRSPVGLVGPVVACRGCPSFILGDTCYCFSSPGALAEMHFTIAHYQMQLYFAANIHDQLHFPAAGYSF